MLQPIALAAGVALLATAQFSAATPGYGHIQPAPRPPEPPRLKSLQEADQFRPFKGTHIEQGRGGLDPYQRPAKPKGYISPY